jgi:hypothetical protein
LQVEQSEKDSPWKIIDSMDGIKLSIPLFVVIDRDGRTQYAGSGGDNLSGLKSVLQRLLPSQ